jgi:MYXO-CTERM domain-containing protein
MMQNRMSELRVLTDGTVPTPGALALLGLAGVAARRRKR